MRRIQILAPETFSSPSGNLAVSNVSSTAVRFLRGLHKKRQERNKSFVKDSQTFSRKWFLELGNNNELSIEKGHEREAFENFARYRTDWGRMKIPLYVSDPKKLPPKRRFDLFYNILQERKGLSAYTKNKYLLESLECFIEMKACGDIKGYFEEWENLYQNHFLYVCDSIIKNSSAYSKIQHSGVASVLRAASICDELGCTEKRTQCLDAAERMAKTLDSHYHFDSKGDIKLNDPWGSKKAIRKHEEKIEKEASYVDRFPGRSKVKQSRPTVFRLNSYAFLPTQKKSKDFYYIKPHLLNLQNEIE